MASSWQSVVNSVTPGHHPQTGGQQNITGLGPSQRKRKAAEVDEDLEVFNKNAATQPSRPLKRQRQVKPVDSDNEIEEDVVVMQTSKEWQLATQKKRIVDVPVQNTSRGQALKRSRSSMEHGVETDGESEIDAQPTKRQKVAATAIDRVSAGSNTGRSVPYDERTCQSSNEKHRYGVASQSSTVPKKKKIAEKKLARKPALPVDRSRNGDSVSRTVTLGPPRSFVVQDALDNGRENRGTESSESIWETQSHNGSNQRSPQTNTKNDFAMPHPALGVSQNTCSGSRDIYEGNHCHQLLRGGYGASVEHPVPTLGLGNYRPSHISGTASFATTDPRAVDMARDSRSLSHQLIGPRNTSSHIAQRAHAENSNTNAIEKRRDPRLMSRLPIEPGVDKPCLTPSREKRNGSPVHLTQARSSIGHGKGAVSNRPHPVSEGEELAYEDFYARTGTRRLFGDEAIDDMFSIAPPGEDQGLEDPLSNDLTLANLPLYDPVLEGSVLEGPVLEDPALDEITVDDPIFDYFDAPMDASVDNLEVPRSTQTSRSTVNETELSSGSLDYPQLPAVLPNMSAPHLNYPDYDDEVRYQQGLAAKGKLREEDDGVRGQDLASTSARSLATDVPVPLSMPAPQKDEFYPALQLPDDEQLLVELAAASAPTEQEIYQALQETIKEYFPTESTAVPAPVEHDFHRDLQLAFNEYFPAEAVSTFAPEEDEFSQAMKLPGDDFFSPEDIEMLKNSDLFSMINYPDDYLFTCERPNTDAARG